MQLTKEELIGFMTLEDVPHSTASRIADELLAALRSQADVRPCQYPNCGCDSRAKCKSLFTGAPASSKEASAPGLSEDEWLALAQRHIREDWNSEQPDGYLNAVKALVQDAMSLTRASAATVAEPSDTLPERDQSKPAEQQGLFRKFIVWRVDGSDAPGGKHHGCEYFVLDMTHDPHAAAALRAYAEACAVTHPQLSADLRARHGAAQSGQRAGVPFEAVAKAYGYLWHVNEMNSVPAPVYEPAKAAYAARKVLREFLTNEQRGAAINEVGREIGCYVDEAERAAAPTQQQEGGNV